MHTKYNQITAKITSYNVITSISNGINYFDQPVNNYERAYDNTQKNTNGQGDDYKTGYLLD